MPRPLQIADQDRQFERYNVQIELRLFFPQQDARFAGFTSNVSVSGALIVTPQKVPAHLFSPVVIEFLNLNGPINITLKGHIVRIAPETWFERLSSLFGNTTSRPFYYAIDFDPLDPGVESHWKKFLSRLKTT